MSGEDIYDITERVWCDICQEPHRSCEDEDDFDLRVHEEDPPS